MKFTTAISAAILAAVVVQGLPVPSPAVSSYEAVPPLTMRSTDAHPLGSVIESGGPHYITVTQDTGRSQDTALVQHSALEKRSFLSSALSSFKMPYFSPRMPSMSLLRMPSAPTWMTGRERLVVNQGPEGGLLLGGKYVDPKNVQSFATSASNSRDRIALINGKVLRIRLPERYPNYMLGSAA